MKLNGAPGCRSTLDAVEARISQIADLQGMTDLPVEEREDFQAFATESKSATMGRTPALYRLSTRTVYLNGAELPRLPEVERQAVLLHEIAHAYLHATDPAGNDCIGADLLVCRWGLSAPLIANRRAPGNYSDEYADLLARVAIEGEDAVRQKLREWQIRRLAGFG